MIKQQNTYFC